MNDKLKVFVVIASFIFMIWGVSQLQFDIKLMLIWLSAANAAMIAGYCKLWIKELDDVKGRVDVK